ncbi:MAG: hypothetical protein QF767_12505, partial [Alphaproteobacteria bacterium]|nr:hypothetical protein [Alphaproteobacteria bacterium]
MCGSDRSDHENNGGGVSRRKVLAGGLAVAATTGAVAAGTLASLSASEESSARCFPQEIASETTPAARHLHHDLSLDSSTKKII